jgi:hypothetical protein
MPVSSDGTHRKISRKAKGHLQKRCYFNEEVAQAAGASQGGDVALIV